eukprot:symbB.v1.2.003349.t1/scaffold172.1/size290804/15
MDSFTSTTPTEGQPVATPTVQPKAPGPTARLTFIEQQERISKVVETTFATPQAATQALQTFNWDVQLAVEKILSAHEATKQVLSQRNQVTAPSVTPPPRPAQQVRTSSRDGTLGTVLGGAPSMNSTLSTNSDPLADIPWLGDFLRGFLQGCLGGCVVGIGSAFV